MKLATSTRDGASRVGVIVHEMLFDAHFNDVTERYWRHASPQWSLGKSFDTHAPLGPWTITADEAGDPHDLGLGAS
jgi:hypothetical protein